VKDPLAPFACFVCYMPDVASLRFDKKHGMPYVSCCACGARTFCKSMNAVRGVFCTARIVEALIRQMQSDPNARAVRERDADDDVHALREHIERVAAARAVSETAREDVGHVGSVVPVAAAAK
jgi:transcription elongation factor Elf1